MATTSGLPATTRRRSPAAAARMASSAFRRASALRALGSRTGPKRCFAESRSVMSTTTQVPAVDFTDASAPTGANTRQDLRAVDLQEARLVIAGSMEDQVIEPELEVGSQLLQVLVRIIRDEPSAVGDLLHAPSESLHLARIVDPGLDIGRESQGRPDFGVFQSACSVGVERDLDLDHPVEGAGFAARFRHASRERRQKLLRVQFHPLA